MQSKYTAYPFLYEKSALCDYEVFTDLYASEIGTIYAEVCKEDREDIQFLCELVYHANPCLRNPCTITQEDINRLLDIQERMSVYVPKCFVLPLSANKVAGEFHQLRAKAKQVVRMIVQIQATEDVYVEQNLLDAFNILSQIFFEYALKYADETIVFQSRTYK